MNKGSTKLIVGLISVFMIAVIVYSFSKNTDFLPERNMWNKSSNQEKHSKDKDENKKESEIKDINKPLNMNSEIITDGMTYKIHSITRTKQRGPLPKTTDYDFLTLDNDGTILNDYSYVIVNLTIQNNLEKEKFITLNSYSLLTKESTNEYRDKFELMLFDKRSDVEKRDYFHFTFLPKEKVTFNMGYLIQDEVLNMYKNQMDFIINNGGTNEIFIDKNVRIIKIAF